MCCVHVVGLPANASLIVFGHRHLYSALLFLATAGANFRLATGLICIQDRYLWSLIMLSSIHILRDGIVMRQH